MPHQPIRDAEQLDRQLAELDENPDAPVDSTVRGLHAELETLAKDLRQPLPPDPFEAEPACRQAMEAAKAVAGEMTAAGPPATDAPAAPIPERLEHFRILKLLGQGGMGAVYQAEDTRLGREVALKTMRAELAAKPSAKERFLREARLAAALEHDHIVPIYHVGEADGIPYLAMPFLKGHSLDDVLKTKKTLPPEQVIRLGLQVARGLAAAHERGLIHRDIKPGNLWVEPKGRIKILDFGLARSSHDDIGLTQSGTILGTPSYMAPEQARSMKLDGRADLYSLGVVLYRAATGQLPLKGVDTMSMLTALATETPRPACETNPAVSPAFSALIMRLLAKDPNGRPASAQTVIQDLQALLQPAATIPVAVPSAAPVKQNPWADIDVPDGETEVVSEPARPAPESPRRPRRRWPLVAAGFLGLAVLLAAGIIIIVRDKDGKKITEIEVPAGGKVEIVDNSDPAKMPPKKEPDIKITGGDPDRRAAEYVLSIGGQVQLNDKDQWINAAPLPKEPFRLTGVTLHDNPKVTDAGLAYFKDCKGLTYLDLHRTRVTDAGLAHFQDCKRLTYLRLAGTPVTDAGLAHFRDLKDLKSLDLGATRVTDAGLAHFQDCKGLTRLILNHTPVTDAGLAHFKDFKMLRGLNLGATPVTDAGLAHFQDHENLTYLDLGSTQVTDAGLAHFKDCKGLTVLALSHTRVTDAGLAHFKDCKGLTVLALFHTRVTDAGLAHFKDCKGMSHLSLYNTPVTDAGLAHFKDCKNLLELRLSHMRVTDESLFWIGSQLSLSTLDIYSTRISLLGYEQLKTALPKCKITWSEPNQGVAESVLALGGTVEVGLKGQAARPVKAAAELPRELFQVRRVSLAGVTKPLDKLPELLAQLTFDEFDRLEKLDLSGINGVNYGFLGPIAGLEELSLANAGLNDVSLGQLPKLPALKRLVLDGNEIRGNGLAALSTQPALVELSLGCPSLTDLFANNLAELKQLQRLSLAGSGLGDKGIQHLEGLTNLETLDLRKTNVTAAGIERLQKAVPKCQIEWDGAKK